MKVLNLTFILLFLFSLSMQAQQEGAIVLKVKNNQKFVTFVNQEQINSTPLSNIEITGLIADYYKVTIQLSNNKMSYNLYVAPDSEIVYVLNTSYSYQKQNYFIEDIYPLPSRQGMNSFDFQQSNANVGNINNGFGQINININNQVNTQQTTNVPNSQQEVVYVEGYNGEIGCEVPVDSNRFESMLATIKNQDFASSKKRVAKQIISSNCILTDNLVQILNLFDFESSKLEIAKFAFDYTYDIENYYKVNNVFDFESSKAALDKYISGK